MQRGSDNVLLIAAIILAVLTAALSSEFVQRDMDDYFAPQSSLALEKTEQVVGAVMSADPSRASTPTDWRLALTGK